MSFFGFGPSSLQQNPQTWESRVLNALLRIEGNLQRIRHRLERIEERMEAKPEDPAGDGQ